MSRLISCSLVTSYCQSSYFHCYYSALYYIPLIYQELFRIFFALRILGLIVSNLVWSALSIELSQAFVLASCICYRLPIAQHSCWRLAILNQISIVYTVPFVVRIINLCFIWWFCLLQLMVACCLACYRLLCPTLHH